MGCRFPLMDITSPQEMAAFAEDVRTQREPFTTTTAALIQSMLGAEYHRLRAAGLESGTNQAVLTVTVSCNFNPESRTVEGEMAPAPVQPKIRRKGAAIEPASG